MRLLHLAGAILLLFEMAGFAGAPADGLSINVSVVNGTNQPIPGVQVELRSGQAVIATAETDPDGHTALTGLKPGQYDVTAMKDGFQTAHRGNLLLSQSGATSLEFTLAPPTTQHDSVEVKGAAAPVDQGASSPTAVPAQLAKELPGRPPTVSDALPLIPGVVRSPGGGLILSAAGEHRSALIVNSADVTDPATGQFGLTVPIDRVETLNFYQTPFLAEFGRFSAGLVSVETRRGGDQWKWELNDPFPDFRIRSYQVRGVRDTTPRLNFEGPLIPGKLYFSEGFEYELRKTEVYELPFPRNQKKQEGLNSFAQVDWIASSKQLVTATVHIAP